MAAVDPDVAKFFERHFSSWKNALARWHKKCGASLEKQKLQLKRDFPVADRRGPISGFRDPNAAVSDATPYGYPSKSLADQKTESEVEKRAAKCKETISRIQKMMERLNKARTTGIFQPTNQLEVKIRNKPTFLEETANKNKIERGDKIEVLTLQGDWMHVRGPDGTEGWVHTKDIMPKLPIEYSSEPGSGPGNRPLNRNEVGEGGRG